MAYPIGDHGSNTVDIQHSTISRQEGLCAHVTAFGKIGAERFIAREQRINLCSFLRFRRLLTGDI